MSQTCQVLCGDNLALMRAMPAQSVDMVFTSPPYEAARTYGIGFNLRGQEWVDWAVERFVECLRVCRGLVAWNVEGQTRDYSWSGVPMLMAADLIRRGVCLRKPPIFHRVGIPGSGGPDWLRNDYEFIVCGTSAQGRLAWSENAVMGDVPKYSPGGAMSHRLPSGVRAGKPWMHSGTSGYENGDIRKEVAIYNPPDLANPGNVIKCNVGGGAMGSDIAHEGEAPFPEDLAEFFIRSWCPPGGTVLDPHSGSGTTAKVALKWGRNAIAIDIRESQCELTRKRIALESPALFTGGIHEFVPAPAGGKGEA